jgi:transcriptional regulator with XRE-family HTH domain
MTYHGIIPAEEARRRQWKVYFRGLIRRWQANAGDEEDTLISKRELASRIGVDATSFNEWLKGEKYPSEESAKKIAKFFDRQVEEVLVASGHYVTERSMAKINESPGNYSSRENSPDNSENDTE